MDEKRAIDAFGAAALIGFALLLGVNQVVIKVTGDGFGPVFQAGLRSALSTLFLLGWVRLRGKSIALPEGAGKWAFLAGCVFAAEFLFLFKALDLTTVSRVSVLFYSMPVWLAIFAHIWLPGERLRAVQVGGLALALFGVAVAMLDRAGGTASIAGDAYAILAAAAWAMIALLMRATPLSGAAPEAPLFYQVLVSAPILLALAPLTGDLVRDPTALHFAGLAFQAIVVVGLGFAFWFWLLSIYKANGVASFSFLSPVFSVLLGWLILGEQIGPRIWIALLLVTGGIIMINRKPKSSVPPVMSRKTSP